MTSCGDISAAISAVNQQISDLTAAISSLELGDVDLSRIEQRLSSLENSLNNTDSIARSASSNASFAKSGVVDLNGKVGTILGAVAVLKGQFGQSLRVGLEAKDIGLGASGKADKNTIEVRKAASGLTNLDKRVRATNQVVSFNRKSISQNRTAIKSAQRIGETAQQVAKRAGKIAGTNRASIKGISNQMKGVLSRLGGLAGRIFAIYNIISSLATMVYVAQLAARVGRNTARSIQNGNLLSSLERQIGDIRNTVQNNVSRLTRLIVEVYQNSSQLGRLEGRFQQLRSSIESGFQRLEQRIRSEVRSVYEELSTLRSQFDSKLQRLEQTLKSEVRKAFDKISELRQQITSQIERVVRDFKAGDRELAEKISELQRQFNQKIQQLTRQFRSELRKLSEKISEILRQVESRIESIRQEFRSDIQRLSERISELVRQLNRQFERLKQYLESRIPTIAAAAAAIAAPIVLGQILSRITQEITRRTPTVTCRYNSAQVGRAVRASEATQATTGVINTFLNGTLLTKINDLTAGTFDRLGAILPNGGISSWLQRFGKSTLVSRALGVLTFISVVHNVSMLSNSISTTLGDALSTGLAVIGIKDENDNPIDINSIVGQQANNFMASILGQEVWTNTKQTWAAANRIYQSASNIVYTLRSITDSSLNVAQWTAEQLAKIGNGLKADGLVNRNAYPWFPEVVTHQNAILRRLESLDDTASSVAMTISEVKNIQDEAAELANQKQQFQQEVDKFQTEKEELVNAAFSESQSPPIAESDLEKP